MPDQPKPSQPPHPAHIVCIFGGGIAGSEAAFRLAERGIYSVVIEMDAVPWGKIELGLPKWHVKQRNMEENQIDEKISHPYVRYIPCTKLGEDVFFEQVAGWGFSAILLAVGAWKDRPLPVSGIDDYEGRGFYYQNPFVAWFNQYHSPDYTGPDMEIHDGVIVVGGGLASLDVVKILMLETTLRALRKRGIEGDLLEMEKKGIPKTLEALGVSWDQLGLEGCRLFYRRRAKDMPLVPMEDDPSPDRLKKVEMVREKLLSNFQTKYLFKFEPCHLPVDKIVENDRIGGLIFRKTEISGDRVLVIPGTDYSVRAPLVISSIGSIPEPIPGLPMERELLQLEDWETGRVAGFENVFALGNAVTGRGNIRASRIHGRQVSDRLMDEFLLWKAEDYEELTRNIQDQTARKTDEIARFLQEKRLRSPEEIQEVFEKVQRRQKEVGYDGCYSGWIDRHRPIRLEEMSDLERGMASGG